MLLLIRIHKYPILQTEPIVRTYFLIIPQQGLFRVFAFLSNEPDLIVKFVSFMSSPPKVCSAIRILCYGKSLNSFSGFAQTLEKLVVIIRSFSVFSWGPLNKKKTKKSISKTVINNRNDNLWCSSKKLDTSLVKCGQPCNRLPDKEVVGVWSR